MSRASRTRRPQTAPTPAAPALPTRVAPVVRAATHSGGQALGRTTQAEMSARFGHDFSQVRIHTDSRAEESAETMGANAYTVGTDIVFRSGAYTPGSPDTERLLAHELTHVVQQSRGGTGDGDRASARGDASEREADALASQVMQGRTVDVKAAPDAAIARDFWDDWKILPPTWKGSTDDTHDQRPGAAQDRDRQRQQEDDKREAQRRGETDPRPKWWEGIFGPQKTSPPPAGPGFGPKDTTTLPYDPNNPLHLPTLPGQSPPVITPPVVPTPSDDTPVPHGPVPFAPEIKGAPNRYDKDEDS